MAVTIGMPVIWGVPSEVKPISNLPPGARVRLRFRCRDVGRAYVRTAEGVSHWILLDRGECWELGIERGRNVGSHKAQNGTRFLRFPVGENVFEISSEVLRGATEENNE